MSKFTKDERGFIILTDEEYVDDVGCLHDCAMGWNPNGVWCGECTRVSGKDCPNRFKTEENIRT